MQLLSTYFQIRPLKHATIDAFYHMTSIKFPSINNKTVYYECVL
jgi:hypothetical protein